MSAGFSEHTQINQRTTSKQKADATNELACNKTFAIHTVEGFNINGLQHIFCGRRFLFSLNGCFPILWIETLLQQFIAGICYSRTLFINQIRFTAIFAAFCNWKDVSCSPLLSFAKVLVNRQKRPFADVLQNSCS